MTPTQFHVQLTDLNQVTISWACGAASETATPGFDARPRKLRGARAELVVEARGANASRRVLRAVGERYAHRCGLAQETLGPSACAVRDYTSPVLYHARVPVAPGERYAYRVASDAAGPWRYFRAPRQGPRVRFAVIGDIGQTDHSARTCRAIAARAEDLDAGILVGDLAYADGNASLWDSFQRLFDREGCAAIPWLVIPGNHDIEPDERTGLPFAHYRARWRTPEHQPGVVGPFHVADKEASKAYRFDARFDYGSSFYSAAVGPATVVALNPYTGTGAASPQARWLQSTLANVDRERTPFVITMTHAPWYHTAALHQPEHEEATAKHRATVEPLLVSAKVDMVLSGHVHALLRTRPMEGVPYVVVGNGGNYEGLARLSAAPHVAAYADDFYGFGILEMSRANGLQWVAYDHDGRPLDSMTQAARHSPPPRPLLDSAGRLAEPRPHVPDAQLPRSPILRGDGLFLRSYQHFREQLGPR